MLFALLAVTESFCDDSPTPPTTRVEPQQQKRSIGHGPLDFGLGIGSLGIGAGYAPSYASGYGVPHIASGGLISGGILSGGLASGGLISGGLVSGGLSSGGIISSGLSSGGLVSGGLVSGGLLSGGLVSSGALLPGPSVGTLLPASPSIALAPTVTKNIVQTVHQPVAVPVPQPFAVPVTR